MSEVHHSQEIGELTIVRPIGSKLCIEEREINPGIRVPIRNILTLQSAGQVAQPWGMWRISAISKEFP